MGHSDHFYNSVINGNENLITVLFWSKTFQFEILSCKIEERIPFSLQLMHLLAVLWKSPARVIWISISQETVCDQKASWVKSLQASADDPDRWQLSIPGQWKRDSRQNLRGMKFEWAEEGCVSLWERGERVGLCLPLEGDGDRLKTCIYGRGLYF